MPEHNRKSEADLGVQSPSSFIKNTQGRRESMRNSRFVQVLLAVVVTVAMIIPAVAPISAQVSGPKDGNT